MESESIPMSRGEKLGLMLVLAGIVSLVVLMLAWTNGSLSAQQPFDAQSWRQAGAGWLEWHPSERKTLVGDLLESRVLIGMRVAEVVELLGPGRATGRGGQMRMTYPLGPLSFSLGAEDTQYLGVELDDGVVQRVYVFEGI